jgi:plasmid maintenance system antidote protein VapI
MGKTAKLMSPVHPGEILREDFMKPLGMSVNKLALELHVPATRIGEIVNLQNFYDLECERRAGKMREIERQVQPVEVDAA